MARKDYSNGVEIPIIIQRPPHAGIMIFGSGAPFTKDKATPPKLGEVYPIDSTVVFNTAGTGAAKRYYTVENTDGKTAIFIQRHGGTGMVRVSIETYYQHDNLDLADRVIEFSAESAMMVGGFAPDIYNLPDGKLYLTVTEARSTSEVRIYAIKCH